MKTIGFCTHFSETDAWALEFALELARKHDWQLTICHWLNSPYNLRRDMVYASLQEQNELKPVTPQLLTQLELQLRQYYDGSLGNFTQVAFKLCEGMYQVELARCLHQNLLDLIVMGYQAPEKLSNSGEQPLEEFALHLSYPLIIVGPEAPHQFRLNPAAQMLAEELALPEGSWTAITVPVSVPA